MPKLKSEEIHNTIKSIMQGDNISIMNSIQRKNTISYIVSDRSKEDKFKVFIKFYLNFEHRQIINEYNNLNHFYKCTKGKRISAPRPLAFDSDKGMIAYEFIDGFTFQKYIFSFENNKNNFEAILKMIAEALAEFHKIFGVEDNNVHLDFKGNAMLENAFRDCALRKIVRPFFDFKPNNIIITSLEDKFRIYLIDFPNIYNYEEMKYLGLPHKDLAYFLHFMLRSGAYPKFVIFKKHGWNNGKIMKLFLNTYFEKNSTKIKKEDIYIINHFLNIHTQDWIKNPGGRIPGRKSQLANLYLKYYSNSLIDIVPKTFNL